VTNGQCRLCCHVTRKMFALTPTPLANNFAPSPDTAAERFPVEVWACVSCGHCQIGYTAPVDWVDYRYATPHANQAHLDQATHAIRERYPQARTAIEIGSNNGVYLDALARVGLEVIGIDPCASRGIAKPFTHQLARGLAPVDLIVANNVFAHVDDLWDVFRGIDHLLGDDGAVVFEVQYLPSMIAAGAFDMIYHEHRDYHTLAPWPLFLKRFGLVITEWTLLPTHGGSIRVYCERPGLAVALLHDTEIDWRAFQRRIQAEKVRIRADVLAVKGPVVAFGATAKACTLLHHFDLTTSLAYCVDDTPAKQGRYLPGTAIQIVPSTRLQEEPPAAMLLTAWNFEAQIRAAYPTIPCIVPFAKER